MPAELLGGDGSDVRREFLRRGVAIGPSQKARNFLTAYLTVSRPKARARCVEQVGWSQGGKALMKNKIDYQAIGRCHSRGAPAR
jgi:hypothetical protein